MAILGKQIMLAGRTQKGKNRVREQGNIWTVMAETDSVLFAPNSPGPWLYVVPVGRAHDDKAGRWIRKTDDLDFAVTWVVDNNQTQV